MSDVVIVLLSALAGGLYAMSLHYKQKAAKLRKELEQYKPTDWRQLAQDFLAPDGGERMRERLREIDPHMWGEEGS